MRLHRKPTDGVGFAWLEIVCFEVQACKNTVLSDGTAPGERLDAYLNWQMPSLNT